MPAAARPYWTGFLKLSLVTISVRLYTATTERERIHFHQIHEPSGERVRYQYMVPGIGPIERDEIAKGYEYEKGRYVIIDADDLKKLRLETTDTIDIVQFVEAGGIDPIYLDSPYYLVPDGSIAEEGYRVLRESLAGSGKLAIGRVVIAGRERVVALTARGDGILVNALRFADEVRRPEEFYQGIGEEPADEDQLALMQQIIEKRTRPFDPAVFIDHYQEALRALVEEKLQGKLPERAPERRPAQVINLMDALKKSLTEEGEDPLHTTQPQRRGGKRATSARASRADRHQRSLLLPVKGGRGKSEAPAASPAEPARRATKRDEREEAPAAPAPRRRRKA